MLEFKIHLGRFLKCGKYVLETFELDFDISVVSVGVWAELKSLVSLKSGSISG